MASVVTDAVAESVGTKSEELALIVTDVVESVTVVMLGVGYGFGCVIEVVVVSGTSLPVNG